jgi:hypothetical protein
VSAIAKKWLPGLVPRRSLGSCYSVRVTREQAYWSGTFA